jgi:transposase-like protein
MKAAAQQRDEQIRVAYLQGKGISQITRELHVASATVQKIARAERQRETARAAGAVF